MKTTQLPDLKERRLRLLRDETDRIVTLSYQDRVLEFLLEFRDVKLGALLRLQGSMSVASLKILASCNDPDLKAEIGLMVEDILANLDKEAILQELVEKRIILVVDNLYRHKKALR